MKCFLEGITCRKSFFFRKKGEITLEYSLFLMCIDIRGFVTMGLSKNNNGG